MLTPSQCRAARALINWSREELASASRLHLGVIADFEQFGREPDERALDALRHALEAAGVVFLDAGSDRSGGPGVRLRRVKSGETIALEDLNAANDE